MENYFHVQDVTVIFRRRGGDDLEQSHAKWVKTVETAPDVINMTFTPIVSLLEGVPGIKHLSRAIELYLECKILSSIHSYIFCIDYFQDSRHDSGELCAIGRQKLLENVSCFRSHCYPLHRNLPFLHSLP